MRRQLLIVGLFIVAGGAAGCARVHSYERETLTLRAMDDDSERAENKFRQHWQESREGAAGGYSSAGGGCGCN